MKVLLHICCAVCATSAVEKLVSEGHEVLGLFYNPNIHPRGEYERRLVAVHQVSRELHFRLEAGHYTPEEWLKETLLLKDEPEGGKRCDVCFKIRLNKTYLHLATCGWEVFATTLTVSPHKAATTINRIGREIGGDRFLARDFKKQQGFKRAIEMSRKWGLYRQNYCGCTYSQKRQPKTKLIAT